MPLILLYVTPNKFRFESDPTERGNVPWSSDENSTTNVLRDVSCPRDEDIVPGMLIPFKNMPVTIPQLLLSQLTLLQLHADMMGTRFALQPQLLSALGDPKPNQRSHIEEF